MTIETTFVNGINPFTTLVPETAAERVEPLNKKHTLYQFISANPLRTRSEIAQATGRTVTSVKQITARMAGYGLIVFEKCQGSRANINLVRVADAVHK